MTALASSSTMSAGMMLHQSVDQLLTDANRPLTLHRHRDEFHTAMREISTNAHGGAGTSALDTFMAADPGNPLLLKEEMESQKDYFRRLKFTHIEQEAKRNFLYSITGDEPQGVQPGENEELEETNARKKTALKVAKTELEEKRVDSLRLASSNAEKHAALAGRLSETRSLQQQIRDMELELARIKAAHPPGDRLTVAQASDLLDAQLVEIERLTEEGEAAKAQIEVVTAEMRRTAKDVDRLGREREREEARAKEVREGREAGDTKVDEMCHWLSSSISFYKSLMGIRSVKAVSASVLDIEYDIPPASNEAQQDLGRSQAKRAKQIVNSSAVLRLAFDETTKRLAMAELLGSDLDISEVTSAAIKGNDVPGLIGDVLVRLRLCPGVDCEYE